MTAELDRRIVVLATLDTKRDAAAFLVDELRRQGATTEVLDLTTVRDPAADKAAVMQATASDAARRLSDLTARGVLGGVIGLGGGQGTWMATAAMQPLPIGLPKMMVTTAARAAGEYLGDSDIVFVPSIVDIDGMNPILAGVLRRSAAAMAATRRLPAPAAERPAVAVSMLGITTAGVALLRERLAGPDRDVVVFHANGSGGRMLERLVAEGRFAAVIDFTISEILDHVVGGRADAGPDRLTSAGARGLAQIVVPGGVDAIKLSAAAAAAPRWGGRVAHAHTPGVTLMRSTPEECAQVGRLVADKLNAARRPAAVVVPEQGFSELDRVGGVFHDAEANRAFVTALRDSLRVGWIHQVDAHINSAAFVSAVVAELEALSDH